MEPAQFAVQLAVLTGSTREVLVLTLLEQELWTRTGLLFSMLASVDNFATPYTGVTLSDWYSRRCKPSSRSPSVAEQYNSW